ncbi:MAG: hypothetical protein KTR31_30085 [Myxococcales bacterium]|nr:hypothetical protein [Myxococcales bacterium]
MLPTLPALVAVVSCTTPPSVQAPDEPGELFHGGPQVTAQQGPPSKLQNRASVVFTKVMHRQYLGRALFIDGTHRGTLPLDVILPVGPHRFEILVGPADRRAFEVDLAPHPGVFLLQLGVE